jgi:hypothetical protein
VNELERMWKEAAVNKFKLLSSRLPGGTERTTEDLTEDIRFPGPGLNTGNPEYAAGDLTSQIQRSALFVQLACTNTGE